MTKKLLEVNLTRDEQNTLAYLQSGSWGSVGADGKRTLIITSGKADAVDALLTKLAAEGVFADKATADPWVKRIAASGALRLDQERLNVFGIQKVVETPPSAPGQPGSNPIRPNTPGNGRPPLR